MGVSADVPGVPAGVPVGVPAVPGRVRRFRAAHRRRVIGKHYAGWAHLGFTSAGALAAVGAALWGLDAVRAAEWLAVPGTFLLANGIEYAIHRGPMHRTAAVAGGGRERGASLLYRRHTRQHHRFFTRDAMACESSRDFQMILFPPIMLLLFLGVVAAPIGLLLYGLATANVGRLFTATAMGYFLLYEWLHFCYHQPPESFLGRLPGMRALRRHHTLHHDPAMMRRWNFNITFSLCDRLFGTRY